MFSQEEIRMLSYNVPRPPAMSAALPDRHWKPDVVEVAPACPRCHSPNTKFCYYNNYSLSQPRYFCKACRRYWTKGGSLRNVPVGGGCRKSRRGKSSRPSTGDHSSAVDPAAARLRPSPAVPIRPDLALEDMVSNSCRIHDVDSPAIDMAVMYAKYLNQSPESQRPEAQIAGEEILQTNYQVEGLEFMDPNTMNYDLSSVGIPMDYNLFDSDHNCDEINIPQLMSEDHEMVFQDFGPLGSLHQPHVDSEWTKLAFPSTESFY